MEKKKYQIAILEDKPDVLQFLVDTLNTVEWFQCNYKYRNAEEAMRFLPQSSADIAIVDIGLPGANGISCVRHVKALRPDIMFMMYTVFDKDDEIFQSLKAGASGYLLKTLDENKITSSVQQLIDGGAPMSPGIARRVIKFFHSGPPNFRALDLLSQREKQVLEELSKGQLYKEIATELGITEGTVRQHIHKIYQKLHVQNRTEAINVYLGRNSI